MSLREVATQSPDDTVVMRLLRSLLRSSLAMTDRSAYDHPSKIDPLRKI
jgi:hypothetical protein